MEIDPLFLSTTEPNFQGRKVPLVGVGCVVVRSDGHLRLARSRNGLWSSPGGHLDIGETPADCAIRETLEETGVPVTNVEFIAITNDILPDVGKHYVTIWMRAEAADDAVVVNDPEEIAEARWFAPDALPQPLHVYFQNLLAGRCLPPAPANFPLARPLVV